MNSNNYCGKMNLQISNSLTRFQNICRNRMATVQSFPSFYHNGLSINYSSIFSYKNFTGRNMNDFNNKTRETIISAIINKIVPVEYNYSIVWKNFTDNLLGFVDNLFSEGDSLGHTSYECRIMAGRNNNYDFLITSTNPEGVQLSKKIEFKFNSTKITGCPQFLSLSSKVNTLYAEYFYDNCVKEITELYGISEAIDKRIYLNHVHQTNYERHAWFSQLYDLECEGDEKHTMKKKIVDKSIHNYLTEEFLNNEEVLEKSIEYWNKKFMDTQGDKIYMLYCPKEKKFYKDEITKDELTIYSEHMGIQTGKSQNIHTLVFYTGENRTTSIKLLLRWRNHAGVLNPAWQISIHR